MDQWCGDKAPGRDNGVYEVVCTLLRGHDGEHREEGTSARWSA